jgi:hypothetical protein
MKRAAFTFVTFCFGVAFAVLVLNGRDALQGQAQPAAAAGYSAVANAVEPRMSRDPTRSSRVGPRTSARVWTFDRSTREMVQYDQQSHLKPSGRWVTFMADCWTCTG